MKKLLVFCFAFLLITVSAQDSIGVRNYFGVNLSPVLGKLVNGADEKARRLGVTYRRCMGLYNLKIAFVGLNDFYPGYTGSNYSYAFDDTTRAKLKAQASNKSRDIRVGLERKWGSKTNKIFLGAGLTVGQYLYEERYTEHYYNTFSDSIGIYVDSDFRSYERGEDKSQYLKIGFDVWAGIAWDIGDHFNFMIQINPDLSTYTLYKNEKEDPISFFPDPKKNFTYMALNAIDFVIGVRF